YDYFSKLAQTIQVFKHPLTAEDRTMKLSRTTIVLSTALLVVPVMIVGTYARQTGRSAPGTGRASA
ncbi:MAG: hypothetical protein ACP5XB_09495, partial [Isosphaeraceae bacterium]